MSKGKLIVIEGGDGAGKSTFVKSLMKTHPEYVFCKQPGGDGTGISQKIRELVLSDDAKVADPLTQFFMFWGSRSETIAKVIKPALSEGKIVVSDRFDASTFAFQVGVNPNLEGLFWNTRKVCLRTIVPVYLNFEVSVSVAEARMEGRPDSNHYDTREDRYRERVKVMYKRFFSNKDIKSHTIDADVSMVDMIRIGEEAFGKALQM